MSGWRLYRQKSDKRYLIVLKIIGIGVCAFKKKNYFYYNTQKSLKKIIPNYNSNYYSFMI